MGLELREHQQLQINDTDVLIGESVLEEVPEDCLGADGAVDICAAGTVAISGLDSYYAARRLRRMAYAKPDVAPTPLS